MLFTNPEAVQTAPYQLTVNREMPAAATTVYPNAVAMAVGPGGPIPTYGNGTAGYPDYQQTCWNTDWLFCILGLICTPLWCVGACLPLCRRPKLPTRSSRVGWAFNLTSSILLLALVIVAVVLVVKHEENGIGSASAASGHNADGSSCSLVQQSCAHTADCCSNTNAGSGLRCSGEVTQSFAPRCLVEEDYACSVNADCFCSTGCSDSHVTCSTLPLTYHTCQPGFH